MTEISSTIPAILPEAERLYWLSHLEDAYGIRTSTFDGHILVRPSPKYLCILPDDHQQPADVEPGSIGMVFIRTNLKHPKLTTAAAMAFGHLATRNLIAVDREKAQAYLNRRSLSVSREEARLCTGTGYVIVKHEEFVLGMGLFRQEVSEGVLESLYPKAWAFH